jgi:hypothetical protein
MVDRKDTMPTRSRAKMMSLCAVACGFLSAAVLMAQKSDTREDFVRKKLAAVEKFAAENQASLRRYTWKETVRFLLKDEIRSTWDFSCRYGPDGKIVRTAVGPPPPGTTAGPFAPRTNRGESREDLEVTMGKVRMVVAMYVPPETAKLEQAFQAGRVRTEKPIHGEALLRVADYARPGDTALLDFRTDQRRLVRLQVSSYLDDPSQAVTIDVRYATLPDGTNYPETIEVAEQSAAMRVMIVGSDYRVGS